MLSWIKDKRIAVWGFGAEGKAAHRFVVNAGSYKELLVLTPDVLEDTKDVQNLHGEEAMQKLGNGEFDIVIKSPGISLYDPVIAAAKLNGTTFTSTTNMWFELHVGAKTIVITGTKGKSTTASLLYHVLGKAGFDVALAGNIGTPLLDIKPAADYTVIELSSYQLADLNFKPDIFVVLNLYPEHLPWHGDVDQYYQDKLSPALNGSKMQIIANDESSNLHKYLDDVKNVIWYNEKEIAEDVKLPLKGSHNRSNFAAISKICSLIGVQENHADLCDGYQALPHRMQELQIGKYLFINDSISTTPQSTIEAIDTYKDENKILIMGGTDRGQDYEEFAQQISSMNVQQIFVLPGHADRLSNSISKYASSDIICTQVENLASAMNTISEILEDENVVLLSPAAPSFTQYKNFEERGNEFIKLAQQIGVN